MSLPAITLPKLAQELLVARVVWRTCINCENFDKTSEGCRRAKGARPPAEVIVYGCDAWVDDIPF